MGAEAQLSQTLHKMRERVEIATGAFAKGGVILVGDDGRRENEADLVFHAAHATPEAVNAAILYARGLLCVSVSHHVADALAFAVAPKLPGDVAHTGFTLSVDAAKDIGSGISARDRSHTIQLMASQTSKPTDFLTPGHVFPVRAHRNGLLARTGHTEALQELCSLAGLAGAAAMCEVLGENGDALATHHLTDPVAAQTPSKSAVKASTAEQLDYLRALPFVTTVDLLWHRVLFQKPGAEFLESWTHSETTDGTRLFRYANSVEQFVTCRVALQLKSTQKLKAHDIALAVGNGFETRSGVNGTEKPAALVTVLMSEGAFDPIVPQLETFCDLSRKEGLASTQPGIKRVVTMLRTLQFLSLKGLLADPADVVLKQWCQSGAFAVNGDADFFESCLDALKF
jgi:3,4-dihydroxy 2-butanone 4-phosphate synthase / GTP cyclohydrolase II